MGQFTIILINDIRGDCNLDVNWDRQEYMPLWNTYHEAKEWADEQLSEKDHYMIVCVVNNHKGES